MKEKMPRTPFSTPLSGSARETELRLKNIFSGPKKRPPALFLALMFSVCIFCGNLVSCQVAQAEEPDRSQQGDSSPSAPDSSADVIYPAEALAQEEQALLEALVASAGQQKDFQLPEARLLTSAWQDNYILGAVFVTDHLENTLIPGVMDRETGELTGPVFRCGQHIGIPNVVTFRDADGRTRLLYTFNGQENGQYTGEAGVVRFDGESIAWEWPAEGDVRDRAGAAYQKYRDYWNGHLALTAPGGVDIYEVNPKFEWGKEEPASMWQVSTDELFYSDPSSAAELPMPIYYQALNWLVGYTTDPGGWRITSLSPNPERCDLKAKTDCFTLRAQGDGGGDTLTADLFFSYVSEPARPRSYSDLVHAEVWERAPLAGIADPAALAAYADVLENLLCRSILPDSTDSGPGFDDMSRNTFAVADVDGDGREELVLLTRPDVYAGYVGYILDYRDGALTIQHTGFPSFTFYDNGAFKENDSHAQGSWTERFWPHSLYRYLPGTDSYELAGHVDAWEKSVSDHPQSTLPTFPAEKDTSGSGALYYINGEKAVDLSVYLDWLKPCIGDARPLELEYLTLTEENIARLK